MCESARRHASQPRLGSSRGPANSGSGRISSDARGAWSVQAVLSPHLETVQAAAVENYHEVVGRGRGSAYLPTVLRAAHDGRVSELFVTDGVERWGTQQNLRRRHYAVDTTKLVNLFGHSERAMKTL
jgi:hypothetical protein